MRGSSNRTYYVVNAEEKVLRVVTEVTQIRENQTTETSRGRAHNESARLVRELSRSLGEVRYALAL